MATSFIVEEDEALKLKLSGLTVSDSSNAARPVQVWYGQPDLELAQRTYPYISIELVDITEANERVMVGKPFMTYLPEGYTDPTDPNQRLSAFWFPTPYDLDYNVTTWSRHPRHDRQLVSRLLSGVLPIRFGGLRLPRSSRTVRLDLLDGPQVADMTDENGKRLFRKVFQVRVATELWPDDVIALTNLVQSVALTVHDPVPVPGTIDETYEQITAVIQ